MEEIKEIDQEKIINQIKSLSIDMINSSEFGNIKENIDAAHILYNLYSNHLKFDIENPLFINRDRVIISQVLTPSLYSTLLVSGFDINLDDLKNYSKWGSLAKGVPKINEIVGVDFTNILSGEEVGAAVGEAIACKKLQNRFNKVKNIINYRTYAIITTNEIDSGSTLEALAFAGSFKLNNLCVIYLGDNDKENINKRISSFGFDVITVVDATNENINMAIEESKKSNVPVFINIIREDKLINKIKNIDEKDNLTMEETFGLKEKLDVRVAPFMVSSSVISDMASIIEVRNNNIAKIFEEDNSNNIDLINFKDYDISLKDFIYEVPEDRCESTYDTMVKIVDYLNKFDNVMVSSNRLENLITYNSYDGNNIKYDERLYSIGTIMNNISNNGFRSFVFIDFSDIYKLYDQILAASIRGDKVTYVVTSDLFDNSRSGISNSFIDAMTHLGNIRGLNLYRPGDANEVIGTIKDILKNNNTSCIVLSQKKVPIIDGANAKDVGRGGYIVEESLERPYGILISCGKELHKAIEVANRLKVKGLYLNVVSVPNVEVFLNQKDKYYEEVLPVAIRKIVIDMTSSSYWYKLIYDDKYLITCNSYMDSMSEDEVDDVLGFSLDTLEEKVEELLK